MTPQEIYSGFLKSEGEVLHLGCGDASLKTILNPSKYIGVDLTEQADVKLDLNIKENYVRLPKDFDYVVLDKVLEEVDDPEALIKYAGKLGTMIVVHEFKYDEDDYSHVQEHWKKPWSLRGLEGFLTDHYDWVNNYFLGYATVHLCTTPNQLLKEKHEN